MMDDRSKLLLKTLVERYIADGQPVGSRTLSKTSGLELSPATIRNVMADLEELGLIASPHTSAGRIPTARGYRVFVDTMLTARPAQFSFEDSAIAPLQPDQPQRVIASAAHLLSNLSHFVGVVTAPRKAGVFRHIEFLRLAERRVLLILVAADGDVQNRVLFTAQDYSPSQLLEASNYLNAHYAGLTIDEVRERLQGEVDRLRVEIATLMQAAVQAGSEAASDEALAFLRARGFSKAETGKIIETVLAEEGRPPESIFDFVQGITALARDKAHQDARLDMEGKAKKLLDRVH